MTLKPAALGQACHRQPAFNFIGMMEYWKNGILEEWNVGMKAQWNHGASKHPIEGSIQKDRIPPNPLFQHSSIPSFQKITDNR
ncbi:MAG: hypothetical protein C4530_22505 [Desulfobacteraceae bacterium]|nr:MAG: hypothetical protein C4530_22505 [Desulfobacteraceae bacterium]